MAVLELLLWTGPRQFSGVKLEDAQADSQASALCDGGGGTCEASRRDPYARHPDSAVSFRGTRDRSEAVRKQEVIKQVSAMLKLTHKAIGAEVRRGTYDVDVDGERVGPVDMSHTIEISVEPGRHTLLVRDGRKSSSTETFDAAEGEIVAFRCTGKRFLPIFLASFIVPRLALKLVRE